MLYAHGEPFAAGLLLFPIQYESAYSPGSSTSFDLTPTPIKNAALQFTTACVGKLSTLTLGFERVKTARAMESSAFSRLGWVECACVLALWR